MSADFFIISSFMRKVVESILSCISSKARTILVYIAVYTLVVYMVLTLIWNGFQSYNWMQQLLFSAGTSVCVGAMMLFFYPFIPKTVKEPYLLLLVYAIFVTITFLFFFYMISTKLYWFTLSYAVALCTVMVTFCNTQKRK